MSTESMIIINPDTWDHMWTMGIIGDWCYDVIEDRASDHVDLSGVGLRWHCRGEARLAVLHTGELGINEEVMEIIDTKQYAYARLKYGI